MLFRQLFDTDSSTYTYLIAADYGREAAIIDPVLEKLPLYLKLIQEFQLQLRMAIDTHVHADHITASGHLHQACGCDIVMGEKSPATQVTRHVKEGEQLDLDGLSLKVLYTPGHTSDCYSFCMSDRVFTGDTLLIRKTGRTDFQNGDAHLAYDSLFNKLLKLPDDTLIYPGHDYEGMMVSTIGEEKNYNPRLQVKNAKEYEKIMNQLDLAYPKLMDKAVPANLCCGMI